MLDGDGDECVAAESDKDIASVDETLRQSSMKNLTRGKSRKAVVPEPLLLSATLRTKNIDHSPANVIVPIQLRKEQVDTPDISDTA